MGNPKRWIWRDNLDWSRPMDMGYKDDEKKFTIVSMLKLKGFYEQVVYDFYSAPDVILSYTNGNTTKDEWMRYFTHTLKNVKLLEVCIGGGTYADCDQLLATFSYEEIIDESYWNDEKGMVTDVPMGKFAGMSYERYLKYKEENQLQLGGFNLPPKMVITS